MSLKEQRSMVPEKELFIKGWPFVYTLCSPGAAVSAECFSGMAELSAAAKTDGF